MHLNVAAIQRRTHSRLCEWAGRPAAADGEHKEMEHTEQSRRFESFCELKIAEL